MNFKNNNIISILVLHFSVLLSLFSCSNKNSKSANSHNPPNVIIIYTDDQGYADINCYGSENLTTPNLDKMAKEGVMLSNFHVAQPVCSASRASLLTGCYSNRIGIHGALFPNSEIGLNPDETTIAEMLKPKGYNTAIYGKWHLGDTEDFMPNNNGFDDYFGIPYSNDMWPLHPWQDKFKFPPLPLYQNHKIIDTLTNQSNLTKVLTQKSLDFIKINKNNPFFLYLAHPQPHVPLFVSDAFKGKSKAGLYGDVIMELDWSVGEILNELKKQGIDENTLVIFASDNGPWLSYGEHAGSAGKLREGKGTVWEGGTRVPCLIRMPSTIPSGKIVSTPVMNIDILPTIGRITGAELPKNEIDGKDIMDVLTGQTKQPVHEAYYFYYKENELQGILSGKWKMYFPHNYRSLNGRKGGTEGTPSPYESIEIQNIELYNLESDVSEKMNVAEHYPKVVDKLMKLAQDKRMELGDNLFGFKGKDNRPAGIK
ncbi:sulfatase [Tamlana fucoidanivorans]|uniref:Sulfatase n=1 Tax=Allotamlana fucoidanivorans TaxID=2583814 RepID=A0A5C4SP39_9FLAO|nr:sulfatase [Tamlana fucoidanivorans]TNJ46044.1 sulfatase [Tamlana fucoidanivorans]